MMTDKNSTPEQDGNDSTTSGIVDQFEHAFLAGLGALSAAQKLGSKTFDSLVEQGEAFRDRTTDSTEELIEQVQDAIRGMADEATAKATGLINHVHDTPGLDGLYGAFDSRVFDTLKRLSVPTKQDIDDLNNKLDEILAAVESRNNTSSTGND